MPKNAATFNQFCLAHSEHEFFCVTKNPGMFMPEKKLGLKNVIYLEQKTDTQAFAQEIIKLKPDLAIALTFWIEPYDWLTVSDSLIAEKLEENGIKTICHNTQTAIICFDKWRTHNELQKLGFNVPPAVFCDHDLYFCAGSNREVLQNVYKETRPVTENF